MAKVSGPMRAAKTKGVKTKPAKAAGKSRAQPKKRAAGKAVAVRKITNSAKPASKAKRVAAIIAPVNGLDVSPLAHATAQPIVAAPASYLTDVLAQSAWQEADDALARALRDFAALERISQLLSSRLRNGAHATEAGAVEDMMLAASQSLRQVGRKRGMQRFGEPGTIVSYDPRLHVLTKAAQKPPTTVKIVAQGVQRGGGSHAEIILKATVAPLRRRQAAAAEKG
jgi:hypothetical protein